MWVQASPRASPVNPAVSLGLETAHVTCSLDLIVYSFALPILILTAL